MEYEYENRVEYIQCVFSAFTHLSIAIAPLCIHFKLQLTLTQITIRNSQCIIVIAMSRLAALTPIILFLLQFLLLPLLLLVDALAALIRSDVIHNGQR